LGRLFYCLRLSGNKKPADASASAGLQLIAAGRSARSRPSVPRCSAADFHRQAIFGGHHITHHIPVHAQIVGQVFALEHRVDHRGVLVDHRRVAIVIQRRVRFEIDLAATAAELVRSLMMRTGVPTGTMPPFPARCC
jgi:hypothetical protein